MPGNIEKLENKVDSVGTKQQIEEKKFPLNVVLRLQFIRSDTGARLGYDESQKVAHVIAREIKENNPEAMKYGKEKGRGYEWTLNVKSTRYLINLIRQTLDIAAEYSTSIRVAQKKDLKPYISRDEMKIKKAHSGELKRDIERTSKYDPLNEIERPMEKAPPGYFELDKIIEMATTPKDEKDKVPAGFGDFIREYQDQVPDRLRKRQFYDHKSIDYMKTLFNGELGRNFMNLQAMKALSDREIHEILTKP